MLILGKYHGQQKNSWLCNSQDELVPIIALFFNGMNVMEAKGTYYLNMLYQQINSVSRINFKFLAAWIIYSVNLCVWMMTVFLLAS